MAEQTVQRFSLLFNLCLTMGIIFLAMAVILFFGLNIYQAFSAIKRNPVSGAKSAGKNKKRHGAHNQKDPVQDPAVEGEAIRTPPDLPQEMMEDTESSPREGEAFIQGSEADDTGDFRIVAEIIRVHDRP